jgi:16S rRNA (cytidine1402-2'-O)-methyltransferase
MFDDDKSRSYIIGQAPFTARPLEPALYLVATPIGNLSDITIRALETLAAADVLACEDTRVTRKLLDRYGIRRRSMPYHEHNSEEAGARLVEAVMSGKSVALVSDAGTPMVSDPGYRIATEVIAAGGKVVPIPGASALLSALSTAGLPSDAFFFAGFLPAKSGQRKTRLEELKAVPGTMVFYESPRRVADSLADMAEVLGDRRAAVGRELTKAFEETRRGTLAELAAAYASEDTPKGEIVVCIAPPDQKPEVIDDIDTLLLSLAEELGASKAAGEAAKMTGGRKSDLYRRLMELKGDAG